MKKTLYTFGLLLLAAALPAQLPGGWSSTDLGSPGAAGTATYLNGVFTLSGSGLNFWDTDDGHFAYVQVDGDFSITARILAFQSEAGLGGAAKTGINARNGLEPDAPSFMMAWEDWGSLAVTSRGGPGIAPEWVGGTAPGADAIPWYLRVERLGDDFYGYESQDSANWVLTTMKTMSAMLPTIYLGLAISPNSDNLAIATFDGVHIDGNVILSAGEAAIRNSRLRVYPNPAGGELFVQFDPGNANVQRVVISDLSGNTVRLYTPQALNGRIDLSGLAPGMYLLQVVTDSGAAAQKFVRI